MNCDAFSEAMARVLTDDEPMTDELRTHVEACKECRCMLDLRSELEGAGLDDDSVSDMEFDQMRKSVLRRIPEKRRFRKRFFPWVWLPAAACLCLGLVLGHQLGARSSGVDALIHDLRSDWADGSSPYALKNVKLQSLGDGRVAYAFDVSTSVESVSSLTDPLIKELWVASLRQPGPLVQRLEALEMAPQSIDADVRSALLFALQYDDALVVRSRAMELLAPFARDGEVSATLIGILRQEPNVQLRLQAIDALMATRPSKSRLDDILADLQRAGDTPVLMRLKNGTHEQEFLASHPNH